VKFNLKPIYDLNIREKLIIAGTIILIVGYALYSIIIPPIACQHKIAARQLTAQKKLMKTRGDKIRSLQRLESAFKALKTNVLETRAKFFTEEEALTFLNGLDSWAGEMRIDIERIKPKSSEIIFSSDREEKINYKINIVEVILSGGYNNILKFLRKINLSGKILGINEVDLKHMKDDPGLLDMRFNLNVYTVVENDVKN